MNRIRVCLVLAAMAVPLAARGGEPGNGFHRRLQGQAGRAVPRADVAAGGELRLGERLPVTMRDVSIVSAANDNSEFRLSLKTAAIPDGLSPFAMILAVDGLYLPVCSHSGRDKDGLVAVDMQVAGLAAARKTAKALGVEPVVRTHPGHKLLVKVGPKQATWRPGEAVTLTMTIKNIGGTPVEFYDGGLQRGPRNNQFSFTASNSRGFGPDLPDTGDSTCMGGLAQVVTLKPGETFTKDVRLTDWFTFREPGTHWITAMYEFGLLDSHGRTIWDDFAVARCTVHIVSPQPASAPAVESPAPPPNTGARAAPCPAALSGRPQGTCTAARGQNR